MKTTGKLWNQYLASWPAGQWFDDSDESVGGKPIWDLGRELSDGDVVEFSCGTVYESAESFAYGKALVRHFSSWNKTLNSASFTCLVPKDKVPAFTAFMKSIGAKASSV